MARAILFALMFALLAVAVFVLGAPFIARAGLAHAAEIAFPIAVLGCGGFGFWAGRERKNARQ